MRGLELKGVEEWKEWNKNRQRPFDTPGRPNSRLRTGSSALKEMSKAWCCYSRVCSFCHQGFCRLSFFLERAQVGIEPGT